MSDKELLELAAKAADYQIDGLACKAIVQMDDELALLIRNSRGGNSIWNPLRSDGDALRLAVKLGLQDGFWFDVEVTAKGHSGARGWCYVEPHGEDPYAATRRAIVRAAAAAICKEKP